MGMVYRPKYRRGDGTVAESAVWWLKYYQDGRPIRESSGTEKETEARKLLKLREGDVARGNPVVPKVEQVRFSELTDLVVANYKLKDRRTVESVEGRIKNHIAPFFGNARAVDVTSDRIVAFAVARREKGASNAEINRELAIIRRAFRLGIKATPRKVHFVPAVEMLEENNARQGFFEQPQFESVVNRLPAYLVPVARFTYMTGWRCRSEVLPLQWRQVDMEAGVIRLERGTTKNKEGRVLPFSGELRAILEEQEARREELKAKGIICPLVFHRNGRRIRDYYTAWRNACRDAGCPGMLMHDLRRTVARNLVRAGVNEQLAMAVTGHKTREVFRRYNITSEADIREATAKLDQYVAGKVAGKVGAPKASVA